LKEKTLNNLDSIAGKIHKTLKEKDEAREKMLPLCRDSIRYSSNAIRAVHRQEFELAVELLNSARSLLTDAGKAVDASSELANTGLTRDAQKEFAEANITLALVTGKSLPEPAELKVDATAYLNGLGEAVGELRRYLLDSMRKGDLSRGEELLSAMDDIYGILVTMDFPDAVTGGLRRTTDMVRGVLERTRSDLTLAMRQKDLEAKLEAYRKKGAGIKMESTQVKGIETEVTGVQPEEKETDQKEAPILDKDELKIYEALSEWRGRKASEENIAPNIIARNSWLKEIIRLNPSTQRDLMVIKGFGERRANKYGRDIIQIIKKDA
jgi:translin